MPGADKLREVIDKVRAIDLATPRGAEDTKNEAWKSIKQLAALVRTDPGILDDCEWKEMRQRVCEAIAERGTKRALLRNQARELQELFGAGAEAVEAVAPAASSEADSAAAKSPSAKESLWSDQVWEEASLEPIVLATTADPRLEPEAEQEPRLDPGATGDARWRSLRPVSTRSTSPQETKRPVFHTENVNALCPGQRQKLFTPRLPAPEQKGDQRKRDDPLAQGWGMIAGFDFQFPQRMNEGKVHRAIQAFELFSQGIHRMSKQTATEDRVKLAALIGGDAEGFMRFTQGLYDYKRSWRRRAPAVVAKVAEMLPAFKEVSDLPTWGELSTSRGLRPAASSASLGGMSMDSTDPPDDDGYIKGYPSQAGAASSASHAPFMGKFEAAPVPRQTADDLDSRGPAGGLASHIGPLVADEPVLKPPANSQEVAVVPAGFLDTCVRNLCHTLGGRRGPQPAPEALLCGREES